VNTFDYNTKIVAHWECLFFERVFMKKIFKCVFGVFLGLFVISFFVNCYLFGMQPEQVVAGMNVSDLGPLIKDIAGIAGDKGGQVALICKLEEFGAVVKFLLEEV